MFDPVFSRLRLALLLGMIVLDGGRLAVAQLPKVLQGAPKPTASATASPTLEEGVVDIKELKAQLASTQSELSNLLANSDPTISGTSSGGNDGILEQREMLSQIVRAYTRHINALSDLDNEAQRHAEIVQEAASWKGFSTQPPYSIRMADGLRESLQSIQEYAKTVASTKALVENASADSQNNLQLCQAKLRQVNEKLEHDGKDPAELAQLKADRDLLQLKIRSRQVSLQMLECERKLASAREANYRSQIDLLNRQIAEASQHEQFTQAELDKINSGAATELRKLDKEMQRVIAQTPSAQRALAEARQNLLSAQQAIANPEAATDEQKAKLAQLQEVVEVRRIQAETVGICEEQLRQLQQFQTMEQAGWQLRFYVFNNDQSKTLEARNKLMASMDRFRVLREYYQEQMAVNARQLSDLEDYVRNNGSSAPASSVKVAQDKADSFRVREDYYKRVLGCLGKLERQGQRWKAEMALKEENIAPEVRVKYWYAGFGEILSRAWNYEIYTVADPNFEGKVRPITVGKVITAVLILLVGYFVCRLLSFKMQYLLTTRLHVEGNLAGIFRGWLMFFLSLGLIMIAMDWVKIPLTAFAFLGGALAIGIGFGTQNLLKNFISGIMLLVERPLRLGDLVEVGASRGRVVNIGIRSSVIRNADGIETLIPNSAFLESNVTNWTYTNPQVRFKIRVGVAFNTSSREVADLLSETVESHGQVFKAPKPQVLLEEFTERGMSFVVYYWLEPLKCDAAGIASDLRFMIEKRLTEAGIMMA